MAAEAHVAAPVLVLAHGVPALARVARSAGLAAEDPPALVDLAVFSGADLPPISVTREEYDSALAALAETSVLGAVDAERGWRRFVWLRSGYDTALVGLAGRTDAPPAPWSSDRALHVGRPRFFSRRPLDTSPHR